MTECSPEELLRSVTDPSRITCLTKGDLIGITVTAEGGLISLIAVLYVVVNVMYNVWWRMYPVRNPRVRVFNSPMDVLMTSLLFGDVLQAIGVVMSLKWVREGKVEIGQFCDAQGIVKIFGATSVALSTLAIAVYTFIGVRRDMPSMRFTIILVFGIWAGIAIIITTAMSLHHNQQDKFFSPTPYWCWVNKYHFGLGWKMAVEYLWMWLTLALSLVIYIKLFFQMRRSIVTSTRAWWRIDFKKSWWRIVSNASLPDLDPESRARHRQSLGMLFYPAVYCICILPLSSIRWKGFVQANFIPSAATFAVVTLFALSGFFNVVLLWKTKPLSGLFRPSLHLPLNETVYPSPEESLILKEAEKLMVETMDKSYDPSTDKYHAQRVRRIAISLATQLSCQDLLVVEMAALLHHVVDRNHLSQSGVNATSYSFLQSYFSSWAIPCGIDINADGRGKVICQIIDNVSWSTEQKLREAESWTEWHDDCIELHCVQDANRLDGIGAFGIMRCAAHSTVNKRPFHTISEDSNFQESSVQHFNEKLVHIYDRLKTHPAKRIGAKRHQLVVDFLSAVYNEHNGDLM